MNDQSRRAFISRSAVGTLAVLADPGKILTQRTIVNKLPKWKGFNLLDFFNPDPSKARPATPPEFFKWMADWGFDFVRVPMAYPSYIKFDRSTPLDRRRVNKFDKEQVEKVDKLVFEAQKHGLHVSLNLHRAPGFCINAGFEEPYNLWFDDEAMHDFARHWKFWAKRYKGMSSNQISFDLLNEPCMREDMNDQFSKRTAVPGHLYRKMAVAASDAIRRQNPDNLIIADGNNIGSEVIPEILDLDIAQSCRGYNPGIISHYKAPWVFKDMDNIPEPLWPGQVGDRYLSRQILEDAYKPWIDLVAQGVGVHCGECGCYNKTPHGVFLAWFADVIDVLGSAGIGFALWEFRGAFGLLDSGRTDVDYEDWYGHKLDRKLLEVLQTG